jgi:hypothetical protein
MIAQSISIKVFEARFANDERGITTFEDVNHVTNSG